MTQTVLINLLAQPSAGKSTTAGDLYQHLKYQNVNVELCFEWVKKWAYAGKQVQPYNQVYIMAKEINQQFPLIGKVDYIISDSPILLAPFYQSCYQGFGADNLLKVALDHLEWAKEQGCRVFNFFLYKNKAYNPIGRYQTETEAELIGLKLYKWLEENNIDFKLISCSDKERVPTILDHIQKNLQGIDIHI